MQNATRPARYVRWLYELLLSVYCALLPMMTDYALYIVDRVRRLPVPLLRLTRGMFSSDPSFNLQYLSWFLLAGIIFVVLRILGQIRPLKRLLCLVAGAAAVAGPLVYYFAIMPHWMCTPSWWQWMEGAAAAGGVLLYANRRWPGSAWLGAFGLLFHFGLWGFLSFHYVDWWGRWDGWWDYRNMIEELVLLPLCTSLAWGFYVWLSARPYSTGKSEAVVH
jgi:hypothetical protein